MVSVIQFLCIFALDQVVREAYLCGMRLYLIPIVLTLFCLLASGCRAGRPLVVERHTTDTVLVTVRERDSIYLHDSIYVTEQLHGDTIVVTTDRWHTCYRDRWHHDSIYIARTDTVPVPYPVERRVPAELSTWQRLRLWLGNAVLVALAVALAFAGFRFWWRIHLKV